VGSSREVLRRPLVAHCRVRVIRWRLLLPFRGLVFPSFLIGQHSRSTPSRRCPFALTKARAFHFPVAHCATLAPRSAHHAYMVTLVVHAPSPTFSRPIPLWFLAGASAQEL